MKAWAVLWTTAVVFCVSAGGCRDAKDESSGYAAASPGAAPAAGADEAKLAALEEVYRQGLLTQAEYEQKRAALRPAALDETTQKRLAALEAARDQGILTGEEYEQKKRQLLAGAEVPAVAPAGGGAAQAQPAAPVTPALLAAPQSAEPAGKVYKHVIGFTFRYPEGWTVREVEQALQLVPPSAATRDGSPAELYFIVGDTVAGSGITSPADPRIAAYLDAQVSGLVPVLQRRDQPQAIPMIHGQGARYTWQGQNERGDVIAAQAMACILKDHGVALMAIGLQQPLQARQNDLRAIFTSFALEQGQTDPSLVGRWHLLTTYTITNDSPWVPRQDRARSVSDTNTWLTFSADGTWTKTENHHMIAMGSGVSLESRDSKTTRGRWNASGGKLCLIHEDGSLDDRQYRIEAVAGSRKLTLVAGQQGQVWQQGQ